MTDSHLWHQAMVAEDRAREDAARDADGGRWSLGETLGRRVVSAPDGA